jgi:hypothetical protein
VRKLEIRKGVGRIVFGPAPDAAVLPLLECIRQLRSGDAGEALQERGWRAVRAVQHDR